MNLITGSLVLVCCGDRPQIERLQASAAAPLAAALGLRPAPPLGDDPRGLDGLHPGLVPLPLDPGQMLAAGDHWAQALGAWRQSCLLLLTAEQTGGGLPAAVTALLLQWQVPLVGLVQWGAPWQADLRRRDGLPWLGWLDAADSEAGLATAAALRWRQLQG